MILEPLQGFIFFSTQDRFWSRLGLLLQIQTKIDLVPQLDKLQESPWIVLNLPQPKYWFPDDVPKAKLASEVR